MMMFIRTAEDKRDWIYAFGIFVLRVWKVLMSDGVSAIFSRGGMFMKRSTRWSDGDEKEDEDEDEESDSFFCTSNDDAAVSC